MKFIEIKNSKYAKTKWLLEIDSIRDLRIIDISDDIVGDGEKYLLLVNDDEYVFKNYAQVNEVYNQIKSELLKREGEK